MSYQIDPETKDLVISGWEKGIAHSPFQGIGNMRNLNVNYYPGVAYVNYERQAATITSGDAIFYAGTHSTNVSGNTGWVFNTPSYTPTMGNPIQSATSPAGINYILDSYGNIFKQSAKNSSSFSVLGNQGRNGVGAGGLAYWNNYLVVFGDGLIEFCGDGTGDSTITGSYWNYTNYSNTGTTITSQTFTVTYGTDPNNIYTAIFPTYIPKYIVGDSVTFTTTGTLPAPLVVGTTYYITSINNTYLTIAASPGGSNITFTTNGVGTHTINDTATPFPIGNCTDAVITAGISEVTGYTNPIGSSVSNQWQGPNGAFNIILPDTTAVLTTFTTGSNALTPTFKTNITVPSSSTINILNPNVTYYRPYVSRQDGNLYFSNGQYLGVLSAEPEKIKFNPFIVNTYAISYGIVELLDSSDSIVDMIDLSSTLIIAGQEKIYTWDYVSVSTTAPVPINEPIIRLENLLNNVYVFTNQKGNIYITNGSYAQYLMKIPDGIVNTIDPVWTIGDVMVHRSRLYFHAVASDTSGNNLLRGVFSIIVSPSLLGEIAKGINMESQGSAGLVPAAGSTSDAVLINNEPSSDGQDSYYCAYSTGASSGVIDYNDTILWSNGEPAIETDMIPIGTILTKRTLGQVQFKLDRPMATGDSISLYARASLADTYTLVGTTTSEVLSDYYPSNLFQGQWLQFKITFSCAATGSSFIPLREVRVQTN